MVIDGQEQDMTDEHAFVHNPHDKLFFAALRNLDIARDAMLAHLPEEILVHMDLSRMQPHKTKLVSPHMKEFHADVMYTIPFKNTSALVLFHCEQITNPQKTVALKVWQYVFLALSEFAENHPDRPLPVPFPLIIYTGESEFRYSTDIFDLFGENGDLTKKYFLRGVKLVDVCRLNDGDIRKHALFGLSEFAFKYKKRREFEKFLETAIPWLDRLVLQIGMEYGTIYIKYVNDVFEDGDYVLFAERAKQYHSEKLEKEAMTISQQLRLEGLKQGMQQGMQQGKVETSRQIATRLLLMAELSMDKIAEVTGLSVNEVKTLRDELQH